MHEKKNNIRISSGFFKGNYIHIKNNCNIRPTSSRLKITLFSYVKQYLKNSVCLDLFAGSGALGIEAASMGAKKVVLVEKNYIVINRLKENIKRLDIKNLKTYNMEAMYYLLHTKEKFNLIFLDPPYKLDIISTIIQTVIKKKILSNNGFIYFELNNLYFFYERFPQIHIHIIKKVGNTFFCLLQYRR